VFVESGVLFRHNDLAWNIRNFIHNNLDKVNLSTNIKFQGCRFPPFTPEYKFSWRWVAK
jgi:hypothetical protein